MREPERIERIINLMKNIWTRYPDMRFGQLYMNLLRQYAVQRGWKTTDDRFANVVWLMEDADFEAFLNNFKGF